MEERVSGGTEGLKEKRTDGSDTVESGRGGAVDVLRQVPDSRLVGCERRKLSVRECVGRQNKERTNVDALLRLPQEADIHQIQHPLRLRLRPILPRTIRQRRLPPVVLPIRQRPPLSQMFTAPRARMTVRTPGPGRRRPLASIVVELDMSEFLTGTPDARVVSFEEEGFGRGGGGTSGRFDARDPGVAHLFGGKVRRGTGGLLLEEFGFLVRLRVGLVGEGDEVCQGERREESERSATTQIESNCCGSDNKLELRREQKGKPERGRNEEKRRTTTRPSVRDVVLLRVEPDVRRRVVDVSEVLDSRIPRRVRDVLEDDDGRTVVVDPLEHAVEGATCEEVEEAGEESE